MGEQYSSNSADLMELVNENRLMAPSAVVQQPASLTVSFPSSSKKWTGSIKIGSSMRLNECMNYIATSSGIENPMISHMQRISGSNSTNMTDESLNDMLNDYADLLKTILIVIPFDDSMLIDYNRTSIFTGASHIVGNRSEHRQRVFILYNCKQQSFAALYAIRADGRFKLCFDSSDDEAICTEIPDFVRKWNSQKCQDSISEMNNIIGNNDVKINGSNSYNTNTVDAQLAPTSTIEKGIFMPASKVLENHLRLALQMVTQMGPQLDHIQLKNIPAHTLLNDFNRLSNEDKIEMVHDQITSISEFLRIATAPIHEEEVEDASSMKIKYERDFAALSDTKNNVNKKIIPIKQRTSRQCKPSSVMKRLETTADTQKPSMLPPQYTAPKLSAEPTPHQHVRMFSELVSGGCPLIQAGDKDGPQQTYVEIEVPSQDGTELHVGVRAVTVKKVKHPFKSVVPQNPPIDTSSIERDGERSCLKCDKNDFDPDLEYAYFPISDEERAQGRKKILAHLINWKRQGVGLKDRVKNENLHLCKLEFYLCVRNGPGKYQIVSTASYSSIIEEGDGPVSINSDAIQPKQLCERGGETIHLPLSVDCPKRGFRVLCNGKQLNEKKFKIHQKQLLVISPSQTSNHTNLHLKILRDEYDNSIEANMERTLYDHCFSYVSHDNQPVHICSKQSFILAHINT